MITIKEKEFRELTDFMKQNYGINLTHKKSLIEGRLSNILVEKGFQNFSEYLKYVFEDSSMKEVAMLINKLTTNHTYFMREANHFQYFQDKILPNLNSTVKSKDLCIWSAGCSSGEEPYTLAMILSDYFGGEKAGWDSKVLATDISAKALSTAERGIYSSESMENVPAYWKTKYFNKTPSSQYEVKNEIKNEVIFRTFNLMNLFPFKKKFHVIFCRNVMIYFDNKTKEKLINKFYEFTEPGGYLFIGHSESINKEESKYKYVMPAVYRKG